NTVEIEFEGALLGDAIPSNEVDLWDALAVLDYVVGNVEGFESYDYPDTNRDSMIDLWDALGILDYVTRNVDEYYS
ncbi:MAG: hypothetical protein WC093_07250, partial [Methanoculleus sp.]